MKLEIENANTQQRRTGALPRTPIVVRAGVGVSVPVSSSWCV